MYAHSLRMKKIADARLLRHRVWPMFTPPGAPSHLHHCALPAASSLIFICLTKLTYHISLNTLLHWLEQLSSHTIKHTFTSKLYQQGKEDSGGNNCPPSLSYVNKGACFITTTFQSHFNTPTTRVPSATFDCNSCLIYKPSCFRYHILLPLVIYLRRQSGDGGRP